MTEESIEEQIELYEDVTLDDALDAIAVLEARIEDLEYAYARFIGGLNFAIRYSAGHDIVPPTEEKQSDDSDKDVSEEDVLRVEPNAGDYPVEEEG